MSNRALHQEIDRLCPVGALELPTDVTWLGNGNVLVADGGSDLGSGNEIIEINRLGQIVWVFRGDLSFPHSCKVTASGGILVADTNKNRVVEVSRDTGIVWSSEQWGSGDGCLDDGSRFWYPNDAEETPAGTILASDRNNDRVIEFTRQGRIVWKYEGVKHPHNADRLPNGNTMIADSDNNRVIEVDPQGNIAWCYGDGSPDVLHWPRDADRLPNGNTLICDSRNDRVLEVDPQGTVVWEFASALRMSPYDADLLPSGNILLSDQPRHRILEVDRAGNIVWCFRNLYLVDPLPAELENGDFGREASRVAGLPRGWLPNIRTGEAGPARFSWETGNAKTGQHCIGIEYDGAGGVFWNQAIQARGGGIYNVSGHIRAEHLDGQAQIQMIPLDRDLALPHFLELDLDPGGQAVSGTTDWVLTEFTAEMPSACTSAQIRCNVRGKGKAWFDDIECYEVPWL